MLDKIIAVIVIYLYNFCNSALVKCNGKVLKPQLCNNQESEYDKGITSFTPGHPMTMKTAVVVYKIAKLDDKALLAKMIRIKYWYLAGKFPDLQRYSRVQINCNITSKSKYIHHISNLRFVRLYAAVGVCHSYNFFGQQRSLL